MLAAALPLARIPDRDEELRAPLRRFLAETLADVPTETRARSWLGFDAAFSRSLGAAGWIGLNLPREYGGSERGAFARFVVVEELLAAGAPVAAHWIADRQSGPLILRYGSEDQRRRHLPAICAGEAYFCIGMSEPGSGSDLASITSRAVRDGDEWRLTGQKIWTTGADKAHFMIALVRTSGQTGDRQAGLSQVLIDLSTPGVTVRPIVDVTGDAHFCEVHFDDVLLPPTAVIGQEGEGWNQVTAELAFERSGPERIYSSVVLLETWLQGLRRAGPGPAERRLAGQLIAELAVLRTLSVNVAARLAAGDSPVLEASVVKDMGTGFEQKVPALIAGLVGAEPDRPVDPDLYRTLAYLLQINPSFSLRGGSREILRGIIARGLGLR